MNQKVVVVLVSFVLTSLALSMRVGEVFLSPPAQTIQIGSLIDLTIEGEFDSRDELNRPLTSPKAQNELKTLFVSGLYSLFMEAKLPAVAGLMDSLTKLAANTATAFTRLVVFYASAICDVIALSLKRTSQYLILQCTVALLSCLLLSAFLTCRCLSSSNSKITLPIRC